VISKEDATATRHVRKTNALLQVMVRGVVRVQFGVKKKRTKDAVTKIW
jgi:hypothetical protein